MNRRVFIIIAIMTTITFVNNFAHPVTPEFVEEIGYGPKLLGSLFAAMAVSNFLMSPIWGILSDKFGRKLFLIIGPIGYGLAQLGFGFSTNQFIIIIFRLIAGGFASASFVAGMAYLIDVTAPNRRTKIMTIFTAITGFAATMGYLVGGYIGDVDYHNAFIAQGTLSISSALVIFLILKESYHKAHVVKRSNIIKDFGKYWNTLVPFLLIITLLTSFVQIGFNISFNSYMKFVLNLGPKKLGQVMAATGTIGLFMNILIFPLIKRKFNDYTVLIISVFFMFTSLLVAMYFEKSHFNITLIVLVIFFAFLALYRPLLQSIISKIGINNGEIMGLNSAFMAIGMVSGSKFAGDLFGFSVNFTIYSFSIISAIVFILLLSKRDKFEEIG